MASLSTDVINLNKNLTTLQKATLSKLDIERLMVQKLQDELDPHIQSHYEFKQFATTKLDALDQTLQDTIDNHLKSHLLLPLVPPLPVPLDLLGFIKVFPRIFPSSNCRKN
jgi:hypothetical protein